MIVAAKNVIAGDRVWNGGKIPAFQWVRVKEVVEHTAASGKVYTIIKTVSWDTWKHPEEGVAVQR
jgi:flavodoxin